MGHATCVFGDEPCHVRSVPEYSLHATNCVHGVDGTKKRTPRASSETYYQLRSRRYVDGQAEDKPFGCMDVTYSPRPVTNLAYRGTVGESANTIHTAPRLFLCYPWSFFPKAPSLFFLHQHSPLLSPKLLASCKDGHHEVKDSASVSRVLGTTPP